MRSLRNWILDTRNYSRNISSSFISSLQSPVSALRPRRSARFGLLPFRSPLLGESLLISSPPATEMFHFAGFASSGLCVQPGMMRYYPHRVAPFGYPRIFARSQLPVAFRSLPRPSSPPDAKASTVCPYYLDLLPCRSSILPLSKNSAKSQSDFAVIGYWCICYW